LEAVADLDGKAGGEIMRVSLPPVGSRDKAPGQGVRGFEAEGIYIINRYTVIFICNTNLMYILIFPQIHDKCQGHKKPFPSLHIRDTFQVILLD